MMDKDFRSAVFACIQALTYLANTNVSSIFGLSLCGLSDKRRTGNVPVNMRISVDACAVNGLIQRH